MSTRMPSMSRAMFMLLSTAAYLELMLLGSGGWESVLVEPALVALLVAFFVLMLVALFAGGNVSSGVREDRSNRWVLGAFAFLGVLTGFFPAYTDRLGFWTINGATTRWIGVAIFCAGGALRLWPVFVLGDRFSGLVAIQRGHTLVTTGIYRVVRNPSYLGLLISSLGWSLAFRSAAGVLLTLTFIPPLIARIHAEEHLLRSEFHEAYDNYCARTWRLIPGLY